MHAPFYSLAGRLLDPQARAVNAGYNRAHHFTYPRFPPPRACSVQRAELPQPAGGGGGDLACIDDEM